MEEGQLFERGQAVTCTERKLKKYEGDGKVPDLFGKIYHVRSYAGKCNGTWTLRLKEFPGNIRFFQDIFAPVISDDQLEDALQEVTLQTV